MSALTVFKCDQCGTISETDSLPDHWFSRNKYSSQDTIAMDLADKDIRVRIKKLHFCSRGCLVAAFASALDQAIKNLEPIAEETTNA